MVNLIKTYQIKEFNVNFGPCHPSAHGVGRFIVTLDGEVIKKVDTNLGLLHRGTEKLLEQKTYLQGISYLSRLDYVSMMQQEHVFILSIEKLLNLSIPIRAKYIRVIFAELTRILNHLLGLTTHQLDLGAITVFLHCFEEREKIFEFYERVSGARMHSAYFRVGGVSKDFPLGLLADIYEFIQKFSSRLDQMEELITNNRIWRQRTVGVGVLTKKQAIEWGLTGIMLRSTGISYDIRKNNSYEIYEKLRFDIILGKNGDCFDRYLMRVQEMRQSINIIQQCLLNLPNGVICINDLKIIAPNRLNIKNSMESLISHFKFFTESFNVKEGECYLPIEASKGEMGVFLISNNTNKPYRVGIRSPGFANLQVLDLISKDYLIADLVANIGTIDIVFGCCDR